MVLPVNVEIGDVDVLHILQMEWAARVSAVTNLSTYGFEFSYILILWCSSISEVLFAVEKKAYFQYLEINSTFMREVLSYSLKIILWGNHSQWYEIPRIQAALSVGEKFEIRFSICVKSRMDYQRDITCSSTLSSNFAIMHYEGEIEINI